MEEYGELCVDTTLGIGHLLRPKLCADNWGLKWIYKELVSLNKYKITDYTGRSETAECGAAFGHNVRGYAAVNFLSS